MDLPAQKKKNPFLPKTDDEIKLEQKYKEASDNLIRNVLSQVPNLRTKQWKFDIPEQESITIKYTDFESDLVDAYWRRVRTSIVYDPYNLVDNLVNYNQDEGFKYFDQIAFNMLRQKLLEQSVNEQIASGLDITYSESTGSNTNDTTTNTKGTNSNTSETKTNNNSTTSNTNSSNTNSTTNGLVTSSNTSSTKSNTDETTSNNNETTSNVTGTNDVATDEHSDDVNHGAQQSKTDTTNSNLTTTNEADSGSTTVDVSSPAQATNTTTNVYDKTLKKTHRLSFDGSTEDEEVDNPSAGNVLSTTQTQEVTPSKTVTNPNTQKDTKTSVTGNETATTNASEYTDITNYGKQHTLTNEKQDSTSTTKVDGKSNTSTTVDTTNEGKQNTYSSTNVNSKGSSDGTSTSTSDTTTTNNGNTTGDTTTSGKGTNQASVKTIHISNGGQLYSLMTKYNEEYKNGIQLWLDGMFSVGIFTF